MSPARLVVAAPSSSPNSLSVSLIDRRPLHPHSHSSRLLPNQERHLLRTSSSLSATLSRAHSLLLSQPDAPKGTSELLLSRVIDEMKAEGKNGLTFGTSSRETLVPEANLGGWRVKMMKKGYKIINKKAGLSKRAEFRVSCRSPCFCSTSALRQNPSGGELGVCLEPSRGRGLRLFLECDLGVRRAVTDDLFPTGQVRVGARASLRLLPSPWLRLVRRSRSYEDDACLIDTCMDSSTHYLLPFVPLHHHSARFLPPRSRTTKEEEDRLSSSLNIRRRSPDS